MLLPHESTVAHEQRFIMDEPMISRTRSRNDKTHVNELENPFDELAELTKDKLSVDDGYKTQADNGTSVPHTRPATPRSVTHNHDEDYSDEESDPNASAHDQNKSDDDLNKSD